MTELNFLLMLGAKRPNNRLLGPVSWRPTPVAPFLHSGMVMVGQVSKAIKTIIRWL